MKGMHSLLQIAVIGMGLCRIAIGLAPFIAARATARLIGFPVAHDTPTTRVMARFFGVRDIGLGVTAFYAVAHPELAPTIFIFNAFMDVGDLYALTIPLVKRQGIDRAALLSAFVALAGCMSWVVVWLIAR
jgi:hypothetical protein